MSFLFDTFIVFLFGFLFLRFTGKKAVSQMHSFDVLYIIVIGNIVSQPIQKDKLWEGMLYTLVFVLLYKLFMRLSLQNKLRWILYESPTVLIRNGDIDRKGLKKVRLPIDEFLAQLRIQGYTETKDIEMATLEDSGVLSVIPKSEYRPVQPADLKIKVKRQYIPIPLIMDGQILDHNLKYLNLDRDWIDQQLQIKRKPLKEIILGTYTESKKLSIDTNSEDGGKNIYMYKPGQDN